MHLWKFKNILLVIAFVRGLIADHSIEHSRPQQDESEEYSTNISHRLPFYVISDRMLKRATILTRPPQRAKTRCSTDQAAGSLIKIPKNPHQMPNRVIQQGRREPPTEAYPCGTSQGDGRLRTMLVTVFGIWLEEPLAAEKERPRHAGMGHTKADTALPEVIEVLLVQRIHDIEPQQQLLSMPR